MHRKDIRIPAHAYGTFKITCSEYSQKHYSVYKPYTGLIVGRLNSKMTEREVMAIFTSHKNGLCASLECCLL